MRKILWVLVLGFAVALAGCAGDDGDDGAPGAPGAPGKDAVDTGTITGVVEDATGAVVSGATVTTDPATQTVTTDDQGTFALADIPVGAYVLTATKDGMGTTTLPVGVAGGATTNVRLTLTADSGTEETSGQILGKVLDVNGQPVAGATVEVEGQGVTATTDETGAFTLEGVEPGFVYLYVTSPDKTIYLDGETRSSIYVAAGDTVEDVTVTLSGRPSDEATYVGMGTCKRCHGDEWADLFAAFDGTASASAHSRFVTEGTSQMVYPDLWPEPGDKVVPRSSTGELLLVQDPQTGEGLVNVVLCTRDGEDGREYLFKFYPETDSPVTDPADEDLLDCSGADGDIFAWKTAQDAGTYDPTAGPVFIPVAATIGGQGNWGEGWADPDHTTPDRHPNFGEGKQRYMCRMQDVPWLRQWAKDNGVTNWLDENYRDWVAYMPVYIMQDGTPVGSEVLGPNDVTGFPAFWEKSPTHWAYPANTWSRGCTGCHSTGVRITSQTFADAHEPGDAKEVVTNVEFTALNVTCERCHGPGSEHVNTKKKAKLILPQYLTAKAANETCGQCHGSHPGKSANPTVHKYAYNADYEDAIGYGYFVPGVYDIEDFFWKFDQPTWAQNEYSGNKLNGEYLGTFHTWPDQTHSRAHSQMLSEMRRSVHYNNSFEKLTCFTCHDAHTLDAPDLEVDGVEFPHAAYADNTLCLACHATHGPFEDLAKQDVKDASGGNFQALSKVARVVAEHMEAEASMGAAPYTPTDPDMPSGACTSCHMPKIGKLQDVKIDAEWHLAWDSNGKSAVAEGNVGSHVFDVVWPAQSAVLVPTATRDADVMPNSCSKCHDFARFSGDDD
ncbi:carboxypeptidase regulatory-like domain-containing protein [Deferrisoma palaeochoriense]